MIEIPEKIPEGMKYYLFTYEYRGHRDGGGFVGDDPEAVYITEPLCRRPEAKDVQVREVTREEFIKDIQLREKNKVNKDFRYFGPEVYRNL